MNISNEAKGKNMKVSVIIPTLNEEELLPNILEDLQNQSLNDYELIVADAGSRDRTPEVAKEYDATIVKGGIPAVGRNNGAKIATGEFLFFLDADVRIPNTFLENAYDEIEERYLDLATCELVPLSEHPLDTFLHDFVNFSIKLSQFSNPHAPGCCILVSRRLYHRIGGFDETLKLAEDHNFARRASRFRSLRVLGSTRISLSVRRLEKEGRIGLTRKYLQVELHRIFLGEIKDELFEYEFGNFTGPKKKVIEEKLEEGRMLIGKINRTYLRFLSRLQEEQLLTETSLKSLENFRAQFESLKKLLGSMLAVRNKK